MTKTLEESSEPELEWSATMAEDDPVPAAAGAEARLQLTNFSAQGLKDVSFLGGSKTTAVAWVDPVYKHYTKTLNTANRCPIWNQTLTFPISARSLFDPAAKITVQVLCHRSLVAGSAVLDLRAVQHDGRVFNLPIER